MAAGGTHHHVRLRVCHGFQLRSRSGAAAAQDWLYDEGEDQTKSVYVEKLAGLRGQGEPIETRYVEAGVRRPAAEKLRGTANAYLNAAQSPDARYAHIDAADKQKVRVYAVVSSALRCPQTLWACLGTELCRTACTVQALAGQAFACLAGTDSVET